MLRPGYTRLSLPYYLSDAAVEYVLGAVDFIAEWGALFMAEYRVDLRTGEWRHKSRMGKPLGKGRVWMSRLDPGAGWAEALGERPELEVDEEQVRRCAGSEEIKRSSLEQRP